jgi:hypothetical protein
VAIALEGIERDQHHQGLQYRHRQGPSARKQGLEGKKEHHTVQDNSGVALTGHHGR